MAVTLEFDWLGGKVQATIHYRKWTCDDPHILSYVQTSTVLSKYRDTGYHPDPDDSIAKFVAQDLRFLGARIIHAAPPDDRPAKDENGNLIIY